MEVVAVVAAVVVGAALITAGVFKLAAGGTWPIQAADLGVPRVVAVLVPWIELVVGVALVVPVFEPWPAIAAVVLLVAFTVVVLWRLRDGSRPPCACYGSRSTRPLGARHVARNVGLLALAAVAAVWS